MYDGMYGLVVKANMWVRHCIRMW